jgi:hypothetical protein
LNQIQADEDPKVIERNANRLSKIERTFIAGKVQISLNNKPVQYRYKAGHSPTKSKKVIKAVEANLLIKIENHKGPWCPYKSIFCQKGICSGCQIYRDKTS